MEQLVEQPRNIRQQVIEEHEKEQEDMFMEVDEEPSSQP